MSGKSGYPRCATYTNYMPYGNITINNITNITNVTNVACHPHRLRVGRRHVGERIENRRPKLLGFYESFGLRDGDKVSGMSVPEFACESADVLSHSAKSSVRHACGIGKSAVKVGSGVCRMAEGVR